MVKWELRQAAARRHHKQVLNFLLNSGADPNKNTVRPETILLVAMIKNPTEMEASKTVTEQLVQFGADVDPPSEEWPGAHYASAIAATAACSNYDAVEALLDLDADTDTERFGGIAAANAIESGNREVVELLLDGASLSARCMIGYI